MTDEPRVSLEDGELEDGELDDDDDGSGGGGFDDGATLDNMGNSEPIGENAPEGPSQLTGGGGTFIIVTIIILLLLLLLLLLQSLKCIAFRVPSNSLKST